MSHTYVLDTSVLLSSPRALAAFKENDVVLPLVVVKELEAKRNDPELGAAARAALRFLESLRVKGGDLAKGVQVNKFGGMLRIEVNHADKSSLPAALHNDHGTDTRILAVAASIRNEGNDVIIVTQDLPMRIVASVVVGLPAVEFTDEDLSGADFGYTGVERIAAGKDVVDLLYKNRVVPFDSIDPSNETLPHLPVNTGLILSAPGSSALGRINHQNEVELIPGELSAFGLHGRSAEQRIALAHLLDPEIGIVSLGGPGGTGKSVLALAAALEAVLEQRTHSKILVFRPLFAVGGQELGYLPGTESEKMNPWSAAVFDALGALGGGDVVEEILARNLIEVLPLTHIRGRTLTDSIVIVDEAQNLERHVLLTALSRLGENSRVFVTHDVAQRDNLRVGRHNGITAVAEKLKGSPLFAHVSLSKSERSPVAALVTGVLDDFD